MKFLSDILAKAGLTVDGVVTLNNTATGQTPDANDNSTKLATTAWVRTFVQPYSLPIASASVLGGIRVGSGLSINSGTGVLSVTGASAASIKSTQTFVVTEGQTVFTVTGGYTPGLMDIFVNGVYLSPNQTTATNGTTFTINDPAATGDIVDIIVSSPIFEGSASTTDQLPEGVVNLYYTNARARAAISLTVTGTSGASTYNSTTGVLNVPTYTLAGLGGVVSTRTITINGVTYDLTANRSWSALPIGGTAGQLLAKIDGTDYNAQWINEAPAASYTSQLKHVVKAGAAINKGQAVYVSSSDGTNMIVNKASNASEQTSSKTLGLLESTVSNNGFTNVITEGLLAGLDTTGANAAGDPVWLGTDGNLIYGLLNKPSAPAHLVFIGVVTRRNANNGEIFIKVQNGFEMGELHDYVQNGVQDNYVISYELSTSLYKPKSIATLLGYTPANAARSLTINGTSYDLTADRTWTLTTSNIAEGTNLYYTDTRVGTYLTANSYATQSYVSTQINNLVSGAPGLLDTLDELAAALGDDPNFATTVSTALSNRLRIDIGTQGLTSTQQGYGRTNLGLGSLAVLSSVGNAQITDLAYSKLTGVPSTFAPSAHTHPISDIVGLQTALDGKQASLSGTGFVKISGSTISYDNSTYYLASNPSGYITSSSLSGYVTLGTDQTITGVKTFSSNIFITKAQADLQLNSTSSGQYGRVIFLENGVEKGGIQYVNSGFNPDTIRRNKIEIFNGDGINFIINGFTNPVLALTSTGSTFRNNLGVGGAAATYPLTAYNGSNGTTAAFGGTSYGLRIDNGGPNSTDMTTIFGVDSSFYGSYQPIRLSGSIVYLGIGHATPVVTVTSTQTSMNFGTNSIFRAVYAGNNIVEIGNYNVANGYREMDIASSVLRLYTGTAGSGSVALALTLATNQNATFNKSVNLLDGSLTIKTTAFGGSLYLQSGATADNWLLYHYSLDNTLRFNYNGAGGDEFIMNTSGASTFAGDMLVNATIQGTRIAIGGSPYPNVGYTLKGTLNGNNDTWGIYQGALTHAPIANNALAVGYEAGGRVDTGTYTGLSYRGFYQESLGANIGTGTLATAYGIYIDSLTRATNNYSAYFAQNVGIGTTTPTALLNVKGSGNYNGTIAIDNGTTTGGGALFIRQNGVNSGFIGLVGGALGTSARDFVYYAEVGLGHSFFVNDGTRVLNITSGGNVGIGTISPTYKLEVAGNLKITSGMLIVPTNSDLYATDGALSYYSATNGVYLNGAGASGWLRLNASGVENDANAINIYGSSNAYMNFRTNSVTRMYISSDGRIGMGTETPSVRLHVVGANSTEGQLHVGNTDVTYSAGINFTTSGTNRGFVGWRHTNSAAPYSLTGIHLFNTDNSNIVFGTNGAVRAVINLNGNLGVNTTTPAYRLDVNGDIRTTGTFYGVASGPSIYENRINAGWDSVGDAIDLWINYEGYQNSTAHFRDFRVGNGKRGSAILFIDGSAGTSNFSGRVNVVSSTDVINATSTTTDARINIGHSVNGGYVGYANIGAGNASNTFYVTTGSGVIGSGITMNNAGNVGIGLTTPSKTLHVYTSGNEGIFLQGAGGGVWMDIQANGGQIHSVGAQVGGMGIYNRTLGFYRFFITDGGDVGIGTSTPGQKLHVVGYTRTHGISLNDGTVAGFIGYEKQWLGSGSNDVAIASEGGNNIRFYTAGTTTVRLMLNTSGQALFNNTTNTTTGGFTNTTMNIKQLADGGSGGGLHIEQSSNTNVAFFGFTGSSFTIGTSYRTSGSYQPINFVTSAVSRIYIETNGFIGIGNSSNPSAWLDIKGSPSTSGNDTSLILRNGNSDGNFNNNHILFGYANTTDYAHAIKTRHQSGSVAGNAYDIYTWKYGDAASTKAGQHVMTIQGNGVGIFTTNPTYALHVVGAIYATADITAFSDISVKENIRTINNALERVTKSRGVIYDRIDTNSKDNIGFIAQELEVEFPELISTNADGTKGVKYQNMVAVLTEAVKEQQTQIESQKSEIEELKDLVKQLINR